MVLYPSQSHVTRLTPVALAVTYRVLTECIQNRVFIVRGNRHRVKDSCRSDVSDRVAGNIPYIPSSAHTAENILP
eukprot:6207362-Pleurochrysis_carterae.AAC.1